MPNYFQYKGESFVHVSDYDALVARLAEAESRLLATDELIDALRLSAQVSAEESAALGARLAEAVKDNERLHAVAGHLIAVIRNVHGHLLDDRIDAALLGATDSADVAQLCQFCGADIRPNSGGTHRDWCPVLHPITTDQPSSSASREVEK